MLQSGPGAAPRPAVSPARPDSARPGPRASQAQVQALASVIAAAHTKCGVNAAKMRRKISGAREMRRKCGAHGGYYTNAAEMRRKCGRNAAKMRRNRACSVKASRKPYKTHAFQ